MSDSSTPRLRLQEAQELDVHFRVSREDVELTAALSRLETWREAENQAALEMDAKTEKKNATENNDPMAEIDQVIEELGTWRQEIEQSREELVSALAQEQVPETKIFEADGTVLLQSAQHSLDKAREDQQRLARLLDRRGLQNHQRLTYNDWQSEDHYSHVRVANETLTNLDIQLTRLRVHFELR